MDDPTRPNEALRYAPFQARIASVALITTVVVLVAACVTFMLQQWAVAREELRHRRLQGGNRLSARREGDVRVYRRAAAHFDRRVVDGL